MLTRSDLGRDTSAGPAQGWTARVVPSQAPDVPETDIDLTGRSFLIVTAPFGRFSRTLARVLRARGAEVSRMIFNAGDLFDWRDRDRIPFNLPAAAWPGRLRRLAERYTDILVFGEGGPYNQGVLSQAESLDARVWVLENGYFRPDWITVEQNGVNARSGLPRAPGGYRTPMAPPEPRHKVGRALPHHVRNIVTYHLLQMLGRPAWRHYSRPYTQPALAQALGHIRRFIGLRFASPADVDADVLAAKGPFFLACLQREGDVQLIRYSRFADNTAFLAEVMSSFARSAPPDARLVVKNHPLDPGLINQAKVVRFLAIEHGVESRVDFIDGGNLAQLCRASRGMVVNNSSAALSALGFGTPVKVLGNAFFDFPGLTDPQPLDGFWRAPTAADAKLFQRFRAHVIGQAQVNGSFHDPALVRVTAEGLAEVFATRRAAPAQLKVVATGG
ncbi:MAG TPA: capsular biosynthesis protein [Brevundimonas sp.]|jgi:capsular polysaccharide export protein|uniref:capsule biosynthesis protein n=1 Tax=Brevundimonas sp. TaxID=1871086 RepID=UPI002E15DF95|nr:capsular biosynthesis protein [Brevundimonas sp.]